MLDNLNNRMYCRALSHCDWPFTLCKQYLRCASCKRTSNLQWFAAAVLDCNKIAKITEIAVDRVLQPTATFSSVLPAATSTASVTVAASICNTVVCCWCCCCMQGSPWLVGSI